MKTKIIGEKSIPNLPWQEKPAGCQDVIWRYSQNPVIKRNILPTSNSVFNSAVVPFEGGFAGVFRVDDKARNMALHVGFSKDGLNWDISPERIHFETDVPEMAEFQSGYDPRVCFIEDRYYITWCNAYGWRPTIGLAYTFDF